jgi:hypothetical protein
MVYFSIGNQCNTHRRFLTGVAFVTLSLTERCVGGAHDNLQYLIFDRFRHNVHISNILTLSQ